MDEVVPGAPAFTTRTGAGTVELLITGDLDVATAESFGAAVHELRPMHVPLTIDLEAVGFVDSSGLRSLLLAHLACVEDTGTAVSLRHVPDRVARLLDLAGLDVVFGMSGAS